MLLMVGMDVDEIQMLPLRYFTWSFTIPSITITKNAAENFLHRILSLPHLFYKFGHTISIPSFLCDMVLPLRIPTIWQLWTPFIWSNLYPFAFFTCIFIALVKKSLLASWSDMVLHTFVEMFLKIERGLMLSISLISFEFFYMVGD